jgi:hypothetical protein
LAGVTGWNTAATAPVMLVAGTSYWLVTVSENVGICTLAAAGSCKSALILWSYISSGLPPDLSPMTWTGMSDEIKVFGTGCNR